MTEDEREQLLAMQQILYSTEVSNWPADTGEEWMREKGEGRVDARRASSQIPIGR